jgi:DNA-binding LacI/PurR family transcriptional regulator
MSTSRAAHGVLAARAGRRGPSGHQMIGAIGAKAVELMQERMSGAKIATRRTIFDVALIERDSVRHLGRR